MLCAVVHEVHIRQVTPNQGSEAICLGSGYHALNHLNKWTRHHTCDIQVSLSLTKRANSLSTFYVHDRRRAKSWALEHDTIVHGWNDGTRKKIRLKHKSIFLVYFPLNNVRIPPCPFFCCHTAARVNIVGRTKNRACIKTRAFSVHSKPNWKHGTVKNTAATRHNTTCTSARISYMYPSGKKKKGKKATQKNGKKKRENGRKKKSKKRRK